MTELLVPDWPFPNNLHACSSTRIGGVSEGPWQLLNLGAHCGDNQEHVMENRRRCYRAANFPAEPVWLEQVHGCEVLTLTSAPPRSRRADAAYTRQVNTVCAVMTADCLPVLFCNKSGTEVAAAHAGWRGLCEGVLEATVACFEERPGNIQAWLGPAIGPRAFEVGPEVRNAFIANDRDADKAFVASGDKFFADLYLLARLRLNKVGITHIYGGEHCTHSEPKQFFSFRRDGTTGRMASFIWLTPP